MLYLKRFTLADEDKNWSIAANSVNMYGLEESFPAGFFSRKNLRELEFEPITFFYGGNGCGKTTLLNIIADTIGAQRKTQPHRTKGMEFFTSACDTHLSKFGQDSLKKAKMLTSNDVFDIIEETKYNNQKTEQEKERLRALYGELKYARVDINNDLERAGEIFAARKSSKRKFVDSRSNAKARQFSNGENAILFFEREINENNLYLLDEPENSMSPALQLELKAIIENHARFFNCQFIIATHSPFLLSASGAKIYDLGGEVKVRKWQELENIKAYYELFKDKAGLFE